MSPSTYDPETLPIGVMGRPHGLRGELVLRPHNAAGRDLGGVPELILEKDGARDVRRVESIRRGADGWLVKLAGVESRTAAAALTNRPARVRRDALPALGPGEFFVADTVGCEVVNTDGVRLGVVDDAFWNGVQDVMVVAGARELLIPIVPAFVSSADVVGRRLVVAWNGEDEAAPGGDDE